MAKPATVKIRLVSTADTGFFYVTKKNPRNLTEKLTFRKYDPVVRKHVEFRSEEHTSELQSLMRISYAVFCFIITTNAKYNMSTNLHEDSIPTHLTTLITYQHMCTTTQKTTPTKSITT